MSDGRNDLDERHPAGWRLHRRGCRGPDRRAGRQRLRCRYQYRRPGKQVANRGAARRRRGAQDSQSVYITGSPGSSPVGSHLRIKGKTLRIKGESLRIQGDSLTLAVTLTGGSAEITSIGGDTYLKADQVGLKMLGAPPVSATPPGRPMARRASGRFQS